MSRSHAEQKIKEALQLMGGNEAKARQQVIQWALEDAKLLKELVKPHMTGIVAHAVSRVVRGKTEPEPVPTVAPGDADTLGMDILRAITDGDTAMFGQENTGRPMKKRGASQQHIDAIQQLIKKSRPKS